MVNEKYHDELGAVAPALIYFDPVATLAVTFALEELMVKVITLAAVAAPFKLTLALTEVPAIALVIGLPAWTKASEAVMPFFDVDVLVLRRLSGRTVTVISDEVPL
jgi:hypothetical protein